MIYENWHLRFKRISLTINANWNDLFEPTHMILIADWHSRSTMKLHQRFMQTDTIYANWHLRLCELTLVIYASWQSRFMRVDTRDLCDSTLMIYANCTCDLCKLPLTTNANWQSRFMRKLSSAFCAKSHTRLSELPLMICANCHSRFMQTATNGVRKPQSATHFFANFNSTFMLNATLDLCLLSQHLNGLSQ